MGEDQINPRLISHTHDPASDGVPEEEQDDRADHGDKKTPNVKSGHAGCSNFLEEPAANQRADNAQHDVQGNALAASVNDFACEKSGKKAQHDPANYAYQHGASPLKNDAPKNKKSRRNQIPKLRDSLRRLTR
jgi:hypothetical protein